MLMAQSSWWWPQTRHCLTENLRRMAARAILAISRTGSPATNGSGDYAVAFSTAESVRRTGTGVQTVSDLSNGNMSPLFQAVVEASEEAIYNSLLKAVTTTSRGRTINELPIDKLKLILKKYGR